MKKRIVRRLTSAVCAFAMLLGSVSVYFPLNAFAEEQVVSGEQAQTQLTHQSIELYPNGEQAQQVVTLDGMMPKGATAEAVDVSDEQQGTAAYDITITDGDSEFQPSKDSPIRVEITDPKITQGSSIELWHIRDDGVREQITDFTFEDGKISFYAAGFSVYEIVVDDDVQPYTGSQGWIKAQSLETVVANAQKGMYIGNIGGTYFFTSHQESNVGGNSSRTGITKTKLPAKNQHPEDAYRTLDDGETYKASKYYIEDAVLNTEKTAVTSCKIYCIEQGSKKYLKQSTNSLSFVTDKSEASSFAIEKPTNDNTAANFIIAGSNNFCCNMQGGVNGSAFAAYSDKGDANAKLSFWYYEPIETDPYKLGGKTYGLMNYTSGTHGFALMAGDKNVHTLVQLVTHKTESNNSATLYVDEGSEVTRWTFQSAGEDTYKLKGDTSSGTKYLTVNGDDLALTDSADSAATFKVSADSNGRIRLGYNGKYVTFSAADEAQNIPASFSLTSGSGADTWLYLLDFAQLSDSDLITYSADRISVSEARSGQRVIVYTRLWNEDTKKYDIYAVDYNGTLYPCYASGGKILWLGDGTGSLEWVFTEYYDEVTKQPNYYYELYNPYSEKYIAPQMHDDQTLSSDTIGINMPGRRNGEFYSEIIAWDNSRYAYIGMKPNDEKTKLVPCSQSVSVPFYFAKLEDLNLDGELHEVATVDNTEHGITMKMFDFDGDANNIVNSEVTKNFFNGNKDNVQGLLYTDLDENGYPTIKSTGKSFKDMYAGAQDVNHLFIESVYNSSGYFEFDSCQNFATLNGKTGGDFTVYRELGTTGEKTKPTLQHGQFYPYNTITAGEYSNASPLNLYNMDALASNNSVGKLDENDPRKYEKLHLIKNTNYFFGMEMSARFVQTVSGLDAWGHDIIFDFTGDDDFWLYVDDELVIDLGGLHSAEHGRVNFRTGEVVFSLVNNGNTGRSETKTTLIDIFRANYTARGLSESEIQTKLDDIFENNGNGQYIFKDYTTHTMRVFYMERGAGASNLHMRFNIASVTPGHVVVSKTISGNGANELDKDFIEYPFQIYYTLPEGENGEPGEEQLLSNDSEHIRVTYQNFNQPVTFVRKYRPPGFSDEDAYQNIYFINPSKNAEISFPDETISYRIVECAVDSTVYGNVKINGEDVPPERVEIKGNLKSYSSEIGTSEKKPSIAFDNVVNDNVIKDLSITKKLLDEDDHEITDDPATFNFRLYISSVAVDESELPLANMYKYYIISPGKKLCRFDYQSGKFAETEFSYSHTLIEQLKQGSVQGISYDDVTFTTSGFGSISGIPSGYTICVPGLPVGSVFKVTEDVKTGYGLMGFECVMGTKVNADNTTEDIPSYLEYDGNPLNVGKVIAEENPQMEVHNKKGYGLTVNKKWSDLELTTAHAPVYTAVYVDGVLLEGSVKQIKSPQTSAYYFWTSLKPYSNGDERTSMSGYTVKEVTISSSSPTVAADGTVTNYGTLTPIDSAGSVRLTATRTAQATPAGENSDKDFNYVVSYTQGADDGAARVDTITNTREGGIAVRLFKWDSADALQGGIFTLTDAAGKTVGTYTSNSEGIVTILYNFEHDKLYTLTQTAAPKGYVGLQKTLRFKVNPDETVSLYYEDGTTAWGETADTDLKWANSKAGINGITAFVDVYNKPFNFKLMKTDSEDKNLKLGAAHFALYKQVNTTVSGYVKNKDPLTGFEDMVTKNGMVDICGGSSGRVINPGENGAVFFLTETKAPFGYTKLDDDIVLRISSIGVTSLISDSYNGQLVETDDSYIYTLSVPNVRTDTEMKLLTITKQVSGAFGSKNKDFTFTVEVQGAGENDEFVWAKNGEEQTKMSHSGGEFTMKHGDVVEIALPQGVDVKVTEKKSEYKTTFRLGDEQDKAENSVQFTFTDSTTLVVTNTLNGNVAAGLSSPLARAVIIICVSAACIGYILCRKRKERLEQN